MAHERIPGDRAARSPARTGRAIRAPAVAQPQPSFELSRALGNQRYTRLIQAKLIVGASDDVYEREADSVAERVIQRLPVAPTVREGPPDLQRQSTNAAAAGPGAPSELSSRTGESRPLPPPVRRQMETAFGRNFGRVRIHTGDRAAALNRTMGARAFTHRHDIFFNTGQFDPATAPGRRLLGHELTHVLQQTGSDAAPASWSGGGVVPGGGHVRSVPLVQGPAMAPQHHVSRAVVQRQPDPAIPEEEEFEDIPVEEPRRHRWLNYDDAIKRNRVWFELLHLEGVNPFAPFNPFDTPNAFVNRVLRWQIAADRANFGMLVFAAEESQRPVRSGTLGTVGAGISEVLARLRAREPVEPGRRVPPDGVLGPRTLWMMMVAAALSTSTRDRQALVRLGIPVDSLEPLTRQGTDEWDLTWRAVHAQLFNPAQIRASWSPLVQSDVVFRVFAERFGYTDAIRTELEAMFFPEGIPGNTLVEDADLTAILSRGYADEALEGIVSVVDVDRTYFGPIDIRKVVETRRRDWMEMRTVNLATAQAEDAEFVMAEFGLGTPTGAQADAAIARLMTQGDWQGSTTGPVSVLIGVFALPPKPDGFWPAIASRYLAERALLERAAEEATEAHLVELEQRFARRMAGTPDIGSSENDAIAFLELLVGPAFTSAQERRISWHVQGARGHDVEIRARRHAARQTARVTALLTRAAEDQFLVIQLSDNREERFPLSLRQIEQSRGQGTANGREPLEFDLIDTPQAAFHMYTPVRFTARAGEGGGAQVAKNPYRLVEGGRSWESWRYFTPRLYGQLEPVLVELREFNPDAGKLFQWGRQLIGTDRIMVRYVWTLGGALTPFSDQLWEAQSRVNLVGWIDAVLTTVALGSVVAAPLGATVAGGTAVGGQVVRATAMTAARRALLGALRKFLVTEAIAESLGRITYAINDDPSVPEEVKKVWNGLMVALLIYGVTATVRQGIRAFRNRPSVRFQRELEALEASLEAEARTARVEPGSAEAAAQADIRQRTAERHRELVTAELGGAPGTGAGRVHSTDPRAAAVSGEAPTVRILTPELEARLRQVLGADAANALATTASDATRRRLALVESDDAIRSLRQALTDEQLATVLARLDAPTLARLGASLESETLRTVLITFMGSVRGLRLLRVFAQYSQLLARLLEVLGPRTLQALAEDPGAERLLRLAERADAESILDALRNMGSNRTQGLDRFRQMVRDIGPEATADVLNTYAGWEIRNRWRRGSGAFTGLSQAQNVARLAIQRSLRPTRGRQRTGIAVPPVPARPQTFRAGDIPSFYAIGPEATAPGALREQVTQLKVATARAATQLDDLMHRAAQGTLTPAEIQALPPNSRATVEAFLRTGPTDANHHALYGSALQYLAEFRLAEMFGGSLPPGVAIRRREVRFGRTLIPDAQIEITLSTELRYPQRNTVERAVIDWTTAGEAGKIAKYRGGTPPVTYAVELIQPGPPRPATAPAPAAPAAPSAPAAPPVPAGP